MRKIILASRSKTRRKLLRQAGIKFRVIESGAGESRSLKRGCRGLVVRNALNKAKSAAKKLDSGVIIAADTVVLAGKTLIGKPRDRKEAFRILKILSRKPQWVYTGLAVIDIDNKKTFIDYDKTKIYMHFLSDAEIKDYLRKISPIDKAGGFNISGLGGNLIKRIDGCFYNVVGLPITKLRKILKKIGIKGNYFSCYNR